MQAILKKKQGYDSVGNGVQCYAFALPTYFDNTIRKSRIYNKGEKI